MSPTRCSWPGEDPLMIRYHDEEWGVPLHDDRQLFEFLVLEGQQAGLSWRTVLHKREAYRQALDGFDYEKIARYNDKKLAALLQNPGIIRNRQKIAATVQNAEAFSKVQEQHGSFDTYIWNFVEGKPIQNAWRSTKEIPAVTPLAETISKDLKKRGFSFVGPTIVYAHMQATGMVNDHCCDCFRHGELGAVTAER